MGIGWGGMGEGLGGGVLGVTLIGNGQNRPETAIRSTRFQVYQARGASPLSTLTRTRSYRLIHDSVWQVTNELSSTASWNAEPTHTGSESPAGCQTLYEEPTRLWSRHWRDSGKRLFSRRDDHHKLLLDTSLSFPASRPTFRRFFKRNLL